MTVAKIAIVIFFSFSYFYFGKSLKIKTQLIETLSYLFQPNKIAEWLDTCNLGVLAFMKVDGLVIQYLL